MKTYRLIVFIVCMCMSAQKFYCAQTLNVIDNKVILGLEDSIYSKILNETRKIWVYIPNNPSIDINSNKKYPVLYLTDGEYHFPYVSTIVEQQSTDGCPFLPEMVVIGIVNIDRDRDLTPTHEDFIVGSDTLFKTCGGGNNFLDFIQNELIPYVEKTYPVNRYRTLVGSSFGGLAVINALFTRHELFDNYISIDPSLWWGNRIMLKMSDSIFSNTNFSGNTLFMGVANTMPAYIDTANVQMDTTPQTDHIRAILKFTHFVQSNKNRSLTFKYKYYNDEVHASVSLINIYDGLRYLFSWYNIKTLDRIIDEKYEASADSMIVEVNNFYKQISLKLGEKILPNEEMINGFGYTFLWRKQYEKSFAFFDLNIRNYPKSSNTYDSMGDYYMERKDTLKALELFTKALDIGHNSFSQKKIDDIRKSMNKD